MHLLIRPAVLLALCLLLIACGKQAEPFHQERIYAFGTLIDVSLWGVDEAKAQAAFTSLGEDFDYMHEEWHAWRPGALAEVNRKLEAGENFTISESMLPLIELSARLSQASQELFNPAIGRLIALWGFHADEPEAGLPDPEQLAKLVAAAPSMGDIHIDGSKLRCDNPKVKLDFGGFAKGFGVDRAMEQLQAMGIGNAIINAGGDLRAIGQRGERAWRVGIRHPRADGVFASLEVSSDESVFTSGDYERFFEHKGKAYHHIIDPRTGYPAEGTASVTVIHDDATTADAAATALLVAGPKRWPEIAGSLGTDRVLVISTGGEVQATPAMARRIRFEVTPEPEVAIRKIHLQ